jgi:hypothetical protein
MSEKLTQHQKLDLIIADINEIKTLLAPTVRKSPFGEPGKPSEGQIIPKAPEPKPEPKEVVWPVVDFSKYTIGTCATCVSYHSLLSEYGYAGLVAEIKKYWDKRETFYQPMKDFMAKYPEFFPCKDCV